MRLYHYTSIPLAKCILSDALRYGHMNTLSGIMHNVAWLTTDDSSDGHGLTTGADRPLSEGQVAYLEKVQGAPLRNRLTQDKTKVRLTYELPEDWTYVVQNFVEYCTSTMERGELFAKSTGLSCYIDLGTASDKRVRDAMKKVKTKEKTWWISLTPIPSKFIVSVDIQVGGIFVQFDFEQHARGELEKIGFFSPTSSALESLSTILPKSNQFEVPDARVICTDPEDAGMVAIRGAGSEWLLSIDEPRVLSGPETHRQELAQWTSSNRDQLLMCWKDAVASYRKFYPAAGTTVA